MFDLDSYLGLHTQALKVRTTRSELLATNIANADTPNFKARDLDFRALLAQTTTDTLALARTQPGHLTASGTDAADLAGDALYRLPMQPSLDGNTVEADVELAAYAENAMRYQATLKFLGGRISGLRDAITGGR